MNVLKEWNVIGLSFVRGDVAALTHELYVATFQQDAAAVALAQVWDTVMMEIRNSAGSTV